MGEFLTVISIIVTTISIIGTIASYFISRAAKGQLSIINELVQSKDVKVAIASLSDSVANISDECHNMEREMLSISEMGHF